MVNLFPMANAALATAIQWGLAGTGGTSVTMEMIHRPSFIMTEGLKAAYPLADQATWFERIANAIKLINRPADMLAYWFVVLAFLAITAHHMMMLIEYHLSVMCGAVLLPWGVWSATASIGEFALGWLTGAFIRALVSVAMVGIATPLFGMLNRPGEGFITIYNSAMLIGGAFIFAVLAWVIPARAAGIASRGMSLAVHAGSLTTAAMGFGRFGMMVHGAGAGATLAYSRMMATRQMAGAGARP
jgi:type IV secretion system protein TrbL